MAGVDVVAQHGWGFGAWCWDRWRDALPAGFALRCPDRGYFGPAVAGAAWPRIVLAHSLGLHLLSPQLCAAAELIVVISGFHSFHSSCARQARRSRRTVGQMRARLERVCLPPAQASRTHTPYPVRRRRTGCLRRSCRCKASTGSPTLYRFAAAVTRILRHTYPR